MMVSFMRCCTSPRKQLWATLLAFALLWTGMAPALADGIQVRRAEGFLSDNTYQISADFDINLNYVVEQALEQGVPLYFISEFTLVHPRWYWLDETVAQSEQTAKLSYNPLSRQYRVTHGSLFQNFASLSDALRIIGHQSSTPIPAGLLKADSSFVGEKLLKKGNSYVAAVRLRLDVSQLPKPLQVNALTGDSWNLDSDWYRWFIQPVPAQ